MFRTTWGLAAADFFSRAGLPAARTADGLQVVFLSAIGYSSYMEGGSISLVEAAMERLKFECPTTGRMVDVGIESEITSLLRIRQNVVHAQCTACGQQHEWLVRDAQLQRAA